MGIALLGTTDDITAYSEDHNCESNITS